MPLHSPVLPLKLCRLVLVSFRDTHYQGWDNTLEHLVAHSSGLCSRSHSRWDLDDYWLLDVEAALNRLLRFSRRVRTATTVASIVSATAPAAAISCAGETCRTVPFTIGSTGKRV